MLIFHNSSSSMMNANVNNSERHNSERQQTSRGYCITFSRY